MGYWRGWLSVKWGIFRPFGVSERWDVGTMAWHHVESMAHPFLNLGLFQLVIQHCLTAMMTSIVSIYITYSFSGYKDILSTLKLNNRVKYIVQCIVKKYRILFIIIYVNTGTNGSVFKVT